MEALSSTLFVSKFSETRTVLHPPSSSSSSSSSSCSLIKIPIKRSGSLKIADTSRFLRVCGLPGDVSGDVEGEDASGFGLVSEESVSSLSEVSFCCKFLRFFYLGFLFFSLWSMGNWWEKERKIGTVTVFVNRLDCLVAGLGLQL